MPELPSQIRLAAGDYFMHGQDLRLRRNGLPGNICHAILQLEPGIDVEKLRKRLAASPIVDWLARVRITRTVPLVAPQWRAAPQPPVIFREHQDGNTNKDDRTFLPQASAAHELHAGRGPALALDLIRHPDNSSRLVLSWNHTLMDARGADLVLRHLFANPQPNGLPTVDHLVNPNQKRHNLANWWENVKTAKGSVKWLHESGREPLFSLMPEIPSGKPCRNCWRAMSFTDDETRRIGARCEQLNASFRRSNFYLAASLRAVHTVAVSRGNQTGAYLIPVPHDMRRRGGSGPIFSNHLSILFYRLNPETASSVTAIIAELSRQMMEQIRTRFPESCMAALDMFKPLPLRYYVHHLGKPTRGKVATFCFSDSGETCAGMTEVFGARIHEVTHLVPAWRPPGLTVVFLTFSGRLSALLSWVDDCLTAAEVDVMERVIRGALLEEDIR